MSFLDIFAQKDQISARVFFRLAPGTLEITGPSSHKLSPVKHDLSSITSGSGLKIAHGGPSVFQLGHAAKAYSRHITGRSAAVVRGKHIDTVT